MQGGIKKPLLVREHLEGQRKQFIHSIAEKEGKDNPEIMVFRSSAPGQAIYSSGGQRKSVEM